MDSPSTNQQKWGGGEEGELRRICPSLNGCELSSLQPELELHYTSHHIRTCSERDILQKLVAKPVSIVHPLFSHFVENRADSRKLVSETDF